MTSCDTFPGSLISSFSTREYRATSNTCDAGRSTYCRKVGFADSGTALCIDQTFMNFIKVLLSNGACIVSPSSAEFHHSLSKSMLDFVHNKHNFKINTGFVNLKPSTADDQLQYLPLESHTLTRVRLRNRKV